VQRGEAAAFADGRGLKLYADYQARLKILNAVDFGDLLLENIRLFRQHTEVLRQYQQRFRFILVDEYQDTNVAQYLWLRLLGQSTTSPPPEGGAAHVNRPYEGDGDALLPPAHTGEVQGAGAPIPVRLEQSAAPTAGDALRPPKNICCVGDDDQSIYGWRGAE